MIYKLNLKLNKDSSEFNKYTKLDKSLTDGFGLVKTDETIQSGFISVTYDAMSQVDSDEELSELSDNILKVYPNLKSSQETWEEESPATGTPMEFTSIVLT